MPYSSITRNQSFEIISDYAPSMYLFLLPCFRRFRFRCLLHFLLIRLMMAYIANTLQIRRITPSSMRATGSARSINISTRTIAAWIARSVLIIVSASTVLRVHNISHSWFFRIHNFPYSSYFRTHIKNLNAGVVAYTSKPMIAMPKSIPTSAI